mgnify:FL=1
MSYQTLQTGGLMARDEEIWTSQQSHFQLYFYCGSVYTII